MPDVAPTPRKQPRWGAWLAWTLIAALIVVFFLLAVLPAQLRSIDRRRQSTCQSNIKQLSLALVAYCEDNDGRFPAARDWCDAIAPRLRGPQVFVCPSAPRQRCSYAFNSALGNLRRDDVVLTAETVELADADGGWNVSGGADLALARHAGGYMCAQVDTLAYWYSASDFPRLNWDPRKDR